MTHLFLRWSLMLALAAVALTAQGPADQSAPTQGETTAQPEDAEDLTLAVIEVHNIEPGRLANTLGVLGIARIQPTERALVVRGSKAVIKVIEEAVRKLDVAPPQPSIIPNVELTVHLLYGSIAEGQDGQLPGELEGTVRQLRSLFPYKSYRVMDSMILRGREGQKTEYSGILGLPAGTNPTNQPSIYELAYVPSVVAGTEPRQVRLNELHMGLRLPIVSGTFRQGEEVQVQYISTGIDTDLDAREGQKTVVGKSNVGGGDAIILVVTPAVIE